VVCRDVEYGLFPTDEFKDVLDDYIEARLHNDGKVKGTEEWTEETIKVRELQQVLVGDGTLPTYLAMDPETREVISLHRLATFNHEDKLLDWLDESREQWKSGDWEPWMSGDWESRMSGDRKSSVADPTINRGLD